MTKLIVAPKNVSRGTCRLTRVADIPDSSVWLCAIHVRNFWLALGLMDPTQFSC